MEIRTADQARERPPYAALADAIFAVMLAGDAGQASAPERSRIALTEDGTLLLRPATDERIAMTKMVQAVDEPGGASDGPVLFKSVGHSLWDLAAARLAFANN